MKIRSLLTSVAVLAGAGGCVNPHAFGRADALIAKFRDLAAAGNYGGVYDLGTADFKARGDKDDLAAMLSAVGRKIAGCQAPRRVGASLVSSPQATLITEDYARTCPNGVVAETFVVRIERKIALLQAYQAETDTPDADDIPDFAPNSHRGLDDGSI
jgi:hypothetical protein